MSLTGAPWRKPARLPAPSHLGAVVLQVCGACVEIEGRPIIVDVDLTARAGEVVALVGPNGAGKSTLLHLLARDDVDVRAGTVRIGRTVVPALLSQSLAGMDTTGTVLSSTHELRAEVEVGRGRTLTARSLLEGFGFSGERMHTQVASLSGGERRRLQLLRLLVGAPNLLLLDEPTNDLDVETLTVVEDLLDTWPGTLVVVSHDRYFLERTTDVQYALLGDGTIRHLPGGVDEYLQRRNESVPESPPAPVASAGLSGGETRALRKELAAIERRTDRLTARVDELHTRLAEHATDHEKVLALNEELGAVEAEKADLEERWLELATRLE